MCYQAEHTMRRGLNATPGDKVRLLLQINADHVQQLQEALRLFHLDALRGTVEHDWGHLLAACKFARRRRRRRMLSNTRIGRNNLQFCFGLEIRKREMPRPHLVRCGIRRGITRRRRILRGSIGGAPATATGNHRHGRAPRLLGLRERPLPERRFWAPQKKAERIIDRR